MKWLRQPFWVLGSIALLLSACLFGDKKGASGSQVAGGGPGGVAPRLATVTLQVKTLLPVVEHLQKLKQAGYQSAELLVITDLDGTLTNYPNPEAIFQGYRSLQPRQGASELLTYLREENIPFLISSAWRTFKDTCQRAKVIEEEVFPSSPGVLLPADCAISSVVPSHASWTQAVHRAGTLVSVKDSRSSDKDHFRGKAFAPLYGLEQTTWGAIKRVVFIDDSADNNIAFQTDYLSLRAANLFPQLEESYDFFEPSKLEAGFEDADYPLARVCLAQVDEENRKVLETLVLGLLNHEQFVKKAYEYDVDTSVASIQKELESLFSTTEQKGALSQIAKDLQAKKPAGGTAAEWFQPVWQKAEVFQAGPPLINWEGLFSKLVPVLTSIDLAGAENIAAGVTKAFHDRKKCVCGVTPSTIVAWTVADRETVIKALVKLIPKDDDE